MKYLFIMLFLVNTMILAGKRSYELTDIRNAQKYILMVEEDLVNEEMRLFVSYRHNIIDSLLVPLMRQIESVSKFQEKFLKVEFERGGGSGVRVRFTSIFCVANSKIVTSLSQISKIYSDITDTYIPKNDNIKGIKYHEDYYTSIKLLKSRKEYLIKMNESYFLKSVIDSIHYEKWANNINLKFNKELSIYYSGQKAIQEQFQIFYLNRTEKTKEINDKYWIIKAKKYTYFWIDSRWFYMKGNQLFEI
ncbi:MAG: hypothetical protein HF314_16985 [Ignavibacteria bacterium]|nr:hypothetical protein [Ignavibacteria bacterium]MCU7504781.1 hypothetical protein [Ignavibacteria bacterium]MCU7518350.1 hypothetical protein [Ignavibacteria bacterium]